MLSIGLVGPQSAMGAGFCGPNTVLGNGLQPLCKYEPPPACMMNAPH